MASSHGRYSDAAWVPLGPLATAEAFAEPRRATYYSMYMEHQRQQPSYARLRSLVRSGSTLDATCALYPTTTRIIIERMRADVVDADQLLSYTNHFVANLQSRRVRKKLGAKTTYSRSAARGTAGADLTHQAQELAANALSTATDDLARPHAPLDRKRPRPRQSLGD